MGFKSVLRRRVDFYDLGDEALSHITAHCSERVFDNIDLLVPNAKRNPPRDFHYNTRGDVGVVNVTPALIEAETAWFSKAFEEEIAEVHKFYAPGTVTVRWGLILATS